MDGLSAYEKVFSNIISQDAANYFLERLKDGHIMHIRTDMQINRINFGLDGVLEKKQRTRVENVEAMPPYLHKACILDDRRRQWQDHYTSWSQSNKSCSEDSYDLIRIMKNTSINMANRQCGVSRMPDSVRGIIDAHTRFSERMN